MPARKMDWLSLESRIRAALRTAESYIDNPAATQNDLALLLVEISEAVGDETGRGYEISSALIARFPDSK